MYIVVTIAEGASIAVTIMVQSWLHVVTTYDSPIAEGASVIAVTVINNTSSL